MEPWEMDWTGVKVDATTPAQNKGKLSVQDNKFLNELRPASQAGIDAQNEYYRAAQAIDRFKPSPWRGKLHDMALPQENGGMGDALGAAVMGPILRGVGVVTPQSVDDFQTLKGLQSERVLSTQLAQKGPQTESDAARMQLSEISPYKSKKANVAVIDAGMRKATLGANKADFYTRWVSKYGLNGLDEGGRSVDNAWFEVSRTARNPKPKKANAYGMVPGAVEDGFQYLGGDPANPKSWRKAK